MGLTLKDLENCYSLAAEAREIRDRISEIESMAERCTPVYSSMPGGDTQGDKVADGAVEMADYLAERRGIAGKLARHVRFVEQAIDNLEDSEERRVMRFLYVDGLTTPEIMAQMFISRSSVYNRRQSALAKLGIEESLDTFGRVSVLE